MNRMCIYHLWAAGVRAEAHNRDYQGWEDRAEVGHTEHGGDMRVQDGAIIRWLLKVGREGRQCDGQRGGVSPAPIRPLAVCTSSSLRSGVSAARSRSR